MTNDEMLKRLRKLSRQGTGSSQLRKATPTHVAAANADAARLQHLLRIKRGRELQKAVAETMKAQYSNGAAPDHDVKQLGRQGLPGGNSPTAPFHQDTNGASQPGKPGTNGPGHVADYQLKPGAREVASAGGHPGNSAVDYDRQIAIYQGLLNEYEGDPFMAADLRQKLAYWSEMKLRFG